MRDTPSRVRRWPGWMVIAGYCCLIFLTVAIEKLEREPEASCEHVRSVQQVPFYDALRSFMLRLIAHPDRPVQVSVVALNGDSPQVHQNVCEGRRYLADLVQAVDAQKPSAIVVDSLYGSETCSNDPDSTVVLRKALNSVNVPVVVGDWANRSDTQIEGSCLVSEPQLFLGRNVDRGLLHVVLTHERIPLQWRVLRRPDEDIDLPAPASSQMEDTLPLATVRSLQKGTEDADTHRLLTSSLQPYARLDVPLPEQSSGAVMCRSGARDARERWKIACGPGTGGPSLAGKVVVIGDQQAGLWLQLGKDRVWDYQVEAAQIDALLSGNYLFPVPLRWIVGMFLLFLAGMEGIVTASALAGPRRRGWILEQALHPIGWPVCFAAVFLLATIGLSLFKHYLPPLLLIADVVFAVAIRIAVLRSRGKRAAGLRETARA